MIHYQLCCTDGHGFDGWFKDSVSFDKQSAAGLLECPTCGSAEVTRALMTPAVRKRARAVPQLSAPSAPEAEKTDPPAAETPIAVDGSRMPAQVRSALQRLRSEIESNCDYVGTSFADEARKIHRGESERRGIYGETTPEQAETLADEGIQVARIPWVPRADG
jgi:hypothetical protein